MTERMKSRKNLDLVVLEVASMEFKVVRYALRRTMMSPSHVSECQRL